MRIEVLMDALGMIDDKMILEAKYPEKKRRNYKKGIVLFAAILLSAVLAMQALAIANVDPIYQMVYMISPSLAQRLKPVRRSCIDNGIEMKVISASVYENEAVIYISLRDLEGNRIDETTDLFDSYRINRPFNSSASCSRAGYDEETGTVTFLISISQWKNQRIEGDKITFSFREFLSNKQKFDGKLDLDLSLAEIDPPTTVRSYHETKDIYKEGDFFQTGKTALYTPVEGVAITGMGFIDGKLHIQTYYENVLETDNHGSVYFVDSAGNEDYGYQISYRNQQDSGRYYEQVFEISPEEWSDYELRGHFITCDPAVKGNWQVTFPLENAE